MTVPTLTTLSEVVRSTGGVIQTGPFGSQLHASDYRLEGTPLVMPTNLRDNRISTDGIARIGGEDVNRLSRHKLRPGDIVFSRRGDVGRRALVTEDERGWVCGTGCLAVRFGRDLSEVNPAYVAHLAGADVAQSWLFDNAVGATMPNLNTGILGALPLAIPSKTEQDRVVLALDEAGAQVDALEQILVKKRDVRAGVTWRLLTGQSRIAGFAAPWLDTTLGAVAKVKTGARNNQDKQSWGRYPFFVRSATVERIDSFSYDCEAILVPGEGGIGSIFHYVNGKFEVHQRVYKISEFAPEVSGRFLFYLVRQFFGAHAMEHSVKATVDSLRLPTFLSFRIRVPAERNEQDAIVDVLVNLDSEIELIERRLESARAIKQGMMQELLTGRTRLVERAAA